MASFVLRPHCYLIKTIHVRMNRMKTNTRACDRNWGLLNRTAAVLLNEEATEFNYCSK